MGLDTEHVEEVLRDRHAAQSLGLAAAAEKVVTRAVESEVAGYGRERLGPSGSVPRCLAQG
jgi:hypothetical protein